MQMRIARLQGDGAAQSVLGFRAAIAAGQQDGVAGMLPGFGIGALRRLGGLGDRFVRASLALEDFTEQPMAMRIVRLHRQRASKAGLRRLQLPVGSQQRAVPMMEPGVGVFTASRFGRFIDGFGQAALSLQQIAQQMTQMPIARLQGDGAAQSVFGFGAAIAAGQQDGVAGTLPSFGIGALRRFGDGHQRALRIAAPFQDVAEQPMSMRIARLHRQRLAQAGLRLLQPPAGGQQPAVPVMEPGVGAFTASRRRRFIEGFGEVALPLQQIAQQVMQMRVARLQGDSAAQSVFGFHTAVAAGQQDGIASVLPRFGIGALRGFGDRHQRAIRIAAPFEDLAEQPMSVRIVRLHR